MRNFLLTLTTMRMYNKDVGINNFANKKRGGPYAYKLVREMNEELKQKGFLTIPGRVSRNYFEEKFYGLRENQ